MLRPFDLLVVSDLFRIPATLLPVPLTGQRLLSPQLLTRLQVEGVSLDLLDNVLLLDLTLEAAKGVFERLALLKLYFSQTKYTSQLDQRVPMRVFWISETLRHLE